MDEDFRLGKQNRRRDHYPRFPAAEMERRRTVIRGMMADEGLDALVVYGDSGFGETHISYLTNYRPPFVSYFVFFADPEADSLLLAGLSNHKQYVREISEADDVDVMLPDPMGQVADRVRTGGADGGRVGIVGHHPRYEQTLSHEHYRALDAELDAALVDATAPYIRVSSVKSDVELDRIRTAASLTDRGVTAMAEAAEPGVSETDLRDELVRTYLDTDGGFGMAFITSAPMDGAEPGESLPWHRPSGRTIREGDVITTEMSASFGGYRSQIHRSFTVGRAPTPKYEDLWAVAHETYESMLDALGPGRTTADVHESLDPIRESPYKIYDVLLHGYGSGYLPPYVGTEASNYWPGEPDPITADWTFRPGNVVVVQPNVVTPDERHGLQLGSAVVIEEDGIDVLQDRPLPIQRL